MRRTSRVVLLGVACLMPLAGCENNQQTGALLGAGGGALVGGLAGRAIGGNRTGALVGMLAGAAIGGFAGSVIGQQLDERDRARAQQATIAVLKAPPPPPEQMASYDPGKPGDKPEPQVRRPSRPMPQQPRTPPATASWQSDQNNNRGSVTLVDVNRSGNTECRTVREVAYIGGREVVQNSRYCDGGDGNWRQS